MPGDLSRARQLVQQAVDGLAGIKPANSNADVFKPLLSGAEAAVATLGRVGRAAVETVDSLRSVEQAGQRVAEALRGLRDAGDGGSSLATGAERSASAAAKLGGSAGEAKGEISALLREIGGLATAAQKGADGETLAERATRNWAAAAQVATGRANELARARLALLNTTLRVTQAEAQPAAAARASSIPVQGVAAPASEPPRASTTPGPVADHPLATGAGPAVEQAPVSVASTARFEQAARAADELALIGRGGINAESALASLRREFALDDEQMARLAQRFEATRAAGESASRGIGASASSVDRLPLALEKAETSYEGIQRSLLGVKASVSATSDAMAKVDDLFAAYGNAARESGNDTQRLATLQEQLKRALAATRDELVANAAAERQADAEAAGAAATARLARAQETRGLPVAPPAPPSVTGAAPTGTDPRATEALGLALQKSQTRAEAFAGALRALGAGGEQTDAALGRAATVLGAFDQAVLASGGNVKAIQTALQELQRGLGQVRGDLSAVATAEREDAAAAAALATEQARVDVALARSAAQASAFLDSLRRVDAGEKETAAAVGQASEAFARQGEVIRASGGDVSAVAIGGARLRTELAGIKSGLEESAAAAAASSGKIGGLVTSLTGVKSAGELAKVAMAGAFGGAGFLIGQEVIQGVRELGQAAIDDGQAWVLAGKQIENVFQVSGESAKVLRQQLADASRGLSLDSTFQLAARFGPALQEMGRSNGDVVKLVATLDRLSVVSGTSTDKASRAFYELSRAISEGALRGQELRVIAGDMPPLLDALARGLGVTRDRLFEMAHAGELTGQTLAQGVLAAAPEIERQFRTMGSTVSIGLTDIANAFEETSGKAAEQTGVIQSLGGAFESFAEFIRGPGFLSVMQEVEGTIASTAHDIQNLIGVINAAVAAGAQADTSTAEGALKRANELKALQAQANAPIIEQHPIQKLEAAASTATGAVAGFLGLGKAEEAKPAPTAPEGRSEADQLTALAAARQQAATFASGAAYVTNPAAGQDATDKAIEKQTEGNKTVVQLKQQIVELTDKQEDAETRVAGLQQAGPRYAEALTAAQVRLSAITKQRADDEKKLETAQNEELARQLAKARDIPLAQAQKTVNLAKNPAANEDTIPKLKAQIDLLKTTQDLERKSGDTDGFRATGQAILNTQQKLHELEQKKATAAANTRDRLLEQTAALEKQADPAAKLVADETKLGQLVRQRAGTKNPGPLPAQDRAAIQTSIGVDYAKAIEQKAASENRSTDPLTQAQAKLAALTQAQANLGTLVKGEAAQRAVAAGIQTRQVALQTQIGDLQAKSDEKLAGQEAGNQKVLANLARQGAEAKAGFQDAALAIKEAGDAAAESIKLPSPEEQQTQGGREQAVKAESEQETARAQAESNEKLKLRAQVLQQVEGADTRYARTVAELNSDLKAGVITQDEYARAVVGVITPEQQFAEETAKLKLQLAEVDAQTATGNKTLAQRNQLLVELQAQAGRAAAAQRQAKVGQLYDRGEPGSGVGEGAAALGGLQAGGLEVIGQYGNIAKAAGATITGAFEQSTDALAQFIATGKGGFPQLVQSLEQMIVKMTIQLFLARALDAAFGAFAGGGGGVTQTALPSTAVGGLLGHAAHGLVFGGGSIVPMAKGGLFDGPTLIPMARGAALAGEAGPEAAVPLIRTADGNLGIRAEGMGGGNKVEVHVHDQRQAGSPVEVQRNSDGQQIKVLIRDAVQEHFGTGAMDRTMRSRYGMTPQPTR